MRCHPDASRLGRLSGAGCQHFVSRWRETLGLLTDLTARNGWSDTLWTAFTALSRWRHGFEPRWGCRHKRQVGTVFVVLTWGFLVSGDHLGCLARAMGTTDSLLRDVSLRRRAQPHRDAGSASDVAVRVDARAAEVLVEEVAHDRLIAAAMTRLVLARQAADRVADDPDADSECDCGPGAR
jgi:hypothetical protein